jgi:hypothetical protein
MEKIFERKCPSCETVLKYKTEYLLNKSLQGSGLCKPCYLSSWHRMKGKTHSDEYKKKRSEMMKGDWNPTKGNKHKPETIEKIKQKRAEQVFTEETRKKMSKARKGKVVSEETRKKMSKSFTGREISEETRLKQSESRKQYFKNMTNEEYDEYCKQRRLVSIEQWENKHDVYPNYNRNSIQILEEKAKELGITDLQHAENGGEFYIEQLGYWVDGYSKEKNIVIEYYESFHENQKEKDLRRQHEITKHLNCKFIIINE